MTLVAPFTSIRTDSASLRRCEMLMTLMVCGESD